MLNKMKKKTIESVPENKRVRIEENKKIINIVELIFTLINYINQNEA